MEVVRQKLATLRASGTFVIAFVYSTLLLDNMLLTAVVPVLPEYFFKKHLDQLDIKESSSVRPANTSSATTTSTTSRNNASTVECPYSSDTAFLSSESLYIGILFASKPLVQIVANVVVGPITDMIGFNVPMFIGYIIIFASSTIFAFGTTYPVLLVARAIQGLGSACSSTAGMGMVADRFPDDSKRGKAMGLALGGLAMGVLVGPVFASVVYQVVGQKEAVFLVLSFLAVILAITQIVVNKLEIERKPLVNGGTPITTLLCDPYIALVAASLMLGNTCIGMLEAGQPIWMIQTMCAEKWELGFALLPESVSYLLLTSLVALACQRFPKWSLCMLGIYLSSVGSLTLPFARSLPEMIGPGLLIGSSVALVDTAMFPIMATLVDTRHTPVYGSVYAIADIAFCLAFIIGPLLAGALISKIGFPWLMRIVGIICFLFAPLALFLRNPPKKEETMSLLYNATPPARTDDIISNSSSSNGRMTDVVNDDE